MNLKIDIIKIRIENTRDYNRLHLWVLKNAIDKYFMYD